MRIDKTRQDKMRDVESRPRVIDWHLRRDRMNVGIHAATQARKVAVILTTGNFSLRHINAFIRYGVAA